MTLAIYFTKRFFVSFIRVFLAIGLLVLLFDFITNLNRLNGLESPVKNAFSLSFLRTTTYLSLAMPLIMMLSSLAFSVGLARNNEFIVSRASGLSALKSLLSVMFSAFIVGIVSIFFLDPIAGRMINSYEQKVNMLNNAKHPTILINDNGYWMRQTTLNGNQIIKASSASNNGKILHNLSIFNYNLNGNIVNRIFAKTGFLKPNEFILTQGVRWTDEKTLSNPKTGSQAFNFFRIPTDITPTQLLEGYAGPETISPWNMNKQIIKVKLSGFSILKYESKQMEQYARPFLFIIMILIGCVFTLKNVRKNNLGLSVVSAVIFGFSLHFFQNFSITLGRSGEIPLIIATWSPILSAGLVTIALFLHYEDG